jgi:DNA polymerase elongation subunit (family B)
MHFNPYHSAHRNVQSAIDYAKSTISDLLQNKMDISMLVITKQLGAFLLEFCVG